MLTPLNFYAQAVLLQGRKLIRNKDAEIGRGRAYAWIRQGLIVGSIDEDSGRALVERWDQFEIAVCDCLSQADDETPEAFLEVQLQRIYLAFREGVEASMPMAA